MADKLRVAVFGAGRWAGMAHVPGWVRDPRCEVVVVCDPAPDRARDLAAQFNIPEHTQDWQTVMSREDIDVIDVVTGNEQHFPLSWAGLETGKHVLCEKPVHRDYRQTTA